MSETTTLDDMKKNVDLINDYHLIIYHTINLAILAAAIAFFGIISNIINIVVFLKEGLSDTVNISLLALSISDLCSLVTLEWLNLLRNPLFIYKVPLLAGEVQHLTAAWPHACFARITSWITVYITLERCLCVVIPFKVKRIVTPKLAVCVCVSICVIMFLTLVPDYATCYLDWQFDYNQNRSMLGLSFLSGRDQMASLSFNLSAGTQISSFGAVIILTVILVVKIREQTNWRKSTSTYGGKSTKDTTTKEKKIVKMVALVAVIYCVCFLPLLVFFIVTTAVPGFLAFDVYNNTFFATYSFACLFDSINASVNIIVYYNMSSRFKTTLNSLLFRKNETAHK